MGSQGIPAPVPVIRQLELVYHETMRTNNWGITLPISRAHGCKGD